MAYLIAIGTTFLLLIVFLALSALETARGFRILSGPRSRLDQKVERAHHIATHVDWGAFTLHLTKTTTERVLHDVVHATLIAVRVAERTLTRLIRELRERVRSANPHDAPVEGSQLIATIVRFRKNLGRERQSTTTAPSDTVEESRGSSVG